MPLPPSDLAPLDLPSPIPARLARLPELACDVWWTWNWRAREVFRRLDYPLWRQTAHNPVLMLQTMAPERLERAAASRVFLELYDEALAELDAARRGDTGWWPAQHGGPGAPPIAYFSAEFALHQSLPIYAGGLGVLAGDTCKQASDMGLPLVGVGFMYPQGYLRQKLSADGWQEEVYQQLDWSQAPIERAAGEDGEPLVVSVPLNARHVDVAIWQVRVGLTRLYLLDTDLESNAPWDRELTARLYGGDRETRIQQEIVLGVGGVLALRRLRIAPVLWHLNEGHAAFVVLERLREHVEGGRGFDDALEDVRGTTVFTTHTPVPAGHDQFPFQAIETHLAGCWGALAEHRERFLALGSWDSGAGTQFNMTALALRTAGRTNAVSALHGIVTREMWANIWPDEAQVRAPVMSVTNGVHASTWMATDMARLLDRYLAADWRDRVDEAAVWAALAEVPDAELWTVRQLLRGHLFTFIRERMRYRWRVDGVAAPRVVAGGILLDPAALTIGFARRFTPYKRPDLVFRDPDRLAAILNATRQPVQLVFAGKAHPADEGGRHALQRVYRHALDPRFAGRVAFVDDYDLHVAHFLVQGCDAWLNNPRRPLEASGTSGMKACVNGVLNISIGDGWWPEAFDGTNGWLIDPGLASDDAEAQDAADAAALYRLLEDEVVPAFYDRDEDGLPRRWIAMVRRAMTTVGPRFSTARMLKDYVTQMYLPLLR